MCESYAGFTNYETYLVSLWLDNDDSYYDAIQNLVDIHEIDDLADAIRDYIYELNPLNSALEDVNWDELAALWYQELK